MEEEAHDSAQSHAENLTKKQVRDENVGTIGRRYTLFAQYTS